MHELAIAREIVAAAQRHAAGRAVTVVRVEVGRLRQVVPEYLSFNFELAARGTLCEGAELEWERRGALLRCSSCGAEWDPAPPPAREEHELVIRFRCPDCGGSDHRVVSGNELLISSIDVIEPTAAATDLGGS